MADRLTKEERKQARRKAKIARVRAARQKKAERDKKASGVTESSKKRTKVRHEAVIVTVLCVIAVGIVMFFAARSFGGVRYTDVEDSARQLVSSSGTGNGYPYKINAADVLELTSFKSNIAMLTRDAVVVLNSTAKEVARFEHGYSDPDMDVYNGRALLYDRTTGKFTVMNSSKIIGDGTVETAIYTAAMGKDGTVAFSVRSDSAQSELVVYNEKLEKIFAWECAQEKIFDIAVAPNGRSAALILVGSENAVTYSRLVVLNFNKDEPIETDIKYDDALLFDVIYPSRNTVIAYSTDFKTTVKGGKEHSEDYSFGSSTLACEAVSDSGRSAIVLHEYANDAKPKVAAFNKNSKLLFEKTFDQKIHAIACTDRYVAVLTDDAVELISSSGKTAKTIEASKNGKRVICSGSDVYVEYASNITKN